MHIRNEITPDENASILSLRCLLDATTHLYKNVYVSKSVLYVCVSVR